MNHLNTRAPRLVAAVMIFSAILIGSISSHTNSYLAQSGEPPTTVNVATCAVSGGIQLYTAVDNNLFEKYGIAIKHVVIRGSCAPLTSFADRRMWLV